MWRAVSLSVDVFENYYYVAKGNIVDRRKGGVVVQGRDRYSEELVQSGRRVQRLHIVRSEIGIHTIEQS
ncbi:unnamed protein product [Calypogeia fissa]